MSHLDEIARIEDLDRRFVWHPFTQMKDWVQEAPVIIVEGRDCFLKDARGRWYLDGVSSLWVSVHGHRKKELDDAVREQLDKVAHTTLLGLTNVPAVRLAEKLIGLTDRSFGGLSPRITKVFYSDNGSTAVEVALKMAFQYWVHLGITGKTAFLCLKNGYHGDTLGAVSVGGIDLFHQVFGPLLFKTYKAPSPYCYRCELGKNESECAFACLGEMERILESHSGEIAAVILEPLVQAAGGIIVAPEGYLRGVRELCSRYGVLMIADEVATGFGRTGTMFACEHERVVPDIMCLSKGITNGYLPLAATLCTDDIYESFLGEFSELKTFFHGHSYTGNPLACAAASACIDVFDREGTLGNLAPKLSVMKDALSAVHELPHVGDARSRGLIAGVELVRDKGSREPYPWEDKMGWKVAYKARERGVLIRPLGNVVVIMPPLSIGVENLARLMEVIRDAIEEVTS
ncbi:MAG: adenosylmethionine--8-amino-7-oxononanoate transaminase [Chloroflexota bacterium]